jgi:signal transduction histidine kinase
MSDVARVSLNAFNGSLEDVRPDATRVRELMLSYEQRVYSRTNRLFVALFPVQWVIAIATALWWSPRGPAGADALKVAALLGGLFTVLPLAAIFCTPYRARTRFAVAFAQAGFSALLILLTAGRIETHFHVFVSMAFLAMYRDWRILAVATAAVVVHHLVLGTWWPAAVYCDPTSNESWLRTAEHGGWVLFENLVLGWSCLISRREALEICQRQEEHLQFNAELERRVSDRTRELEAEMQAREQTAKELHRSEQQHRHLVASLPIGIFESTRSGGVLFANPYLLGLIGLPDTFDPTAITLADGRIFPMADRDRFWARLEQNGEVRGFAATFHHFDGSTFEVVINARLKPTLPGQELVCEGTIEDVTMRKRAEQDLELLHGQLLVASRQAGMAEVASGVLHNVGNVLTSVNLIVHDVQDRLKTTRLTHLHRVVEVLQREQPRLVKFLTEDDGGRQLPEFLAKLDAHLTGENTQLLTDVEGLVRHFEHIREIIVTQQGSAQLFGVLETLSPAQLFEDALRLNAESMDRHGISLERVFDSVGQVKADRHKVLQILVNLLKNAKDALQVIKPGERLIRVRVAAVSGELISLAVQDNGPGIQKANLTRIFQHGFTTKPNGHGFGLHSSVLAAREMGGDLVATSPGLGLGSIFVLTLPKA